MTKSKRKEFLNNCYLNQIKLDHVYVRPNEILNNKWGSFHHNDILGKEWGHTWHSRGQKGWVFALAPTPELWARALPHRTQIVHELDASMIIFNLGLKPGYQGFTFIFFFLIS